MEQRPVLGIRPDAGRTLFPAGVQINHLWLPLGILAGQIKDKGSLRMIPDRLDPAEAPLFGSVPLSLRDFLMVSGFQVPIPLLVVALKNLVHGCLALVRWESERHGEGPDCHGQPLVNTPILSACSNVVHATGAALHLGRRLHFPCVFFPVGYSLDKVGNPNVTIQCSFPPGCPDASRKLQPCTLPVDNASFASDKGASQIAAARCFYIFHVKWQLSVETWAPPIAGMKLR